MKMTFNHRQSVTALGHVIAFLVVVFLGYVSFLGMVYFTGGHIVKSAVVAAVYGTVLFLLCDTFQRLKGVQRHFAKNIIAERLIAIVLLVACVLSALPFTHFFVVNSHEAEVVDAFRGALAEVEPMFDEYDSVANVRIAAYEKDLYKALRSKQQRKTYGMNRHIEGKPEGGDSLVARDMADALRLLLLPPEHARLRKEALAWVQRAGGTTTWNAFLLGNTHEIRHAVDGWRQGMESRLARHIINEQGTDTLCHAAYHAERASQQLNIVENLCATRGFPPLLSIVLLVGCCLLLFFPHWLQSRNSKSWQRFWPRSTRRMMGISSGSNSLVVSETSDDTLVDRPKTESQMFAQEMERAYYKYPGITPFKYILQLIEHGELDSARLAQLIGQDHNLFDLQTVSQLLEYGIVNKDMLTDTCGIPPSYLTHFDDEKTKPPEPTAIGQLDTTSTHVFLWGIPTSGKTCALGAIIKSANAKGMTVDEQCQGYPYYRYLNEEVFKDGSDIIQLPGRTHLTANHAIRMTLDDSKGRQHPITLIDMAGELFCSVVWQEMGINRWVKNEHLQAKAEFERLILSENPAQQKFHFFIIEYGAEDRTYPDVEKDSIYQGYTQDYYLDHGLSYLDHLGVFKNDTEAIYVLVTKTDRVKQNLRPGETESEHLSRYLGTFYENFFGRLQRICQTYELCGGNCPQPLPFSLGEVCMGTLCRLDTTSANDVVGIMLSKSKGFRKGLAGFIERLFDH